MQVVPAAQSLFWMHDVPQVPKKELQSGVAPEHWVGFAHWTHDPTDEQWGVEAEALQSLSERHCAQVLKGVQCGGRPADVQSVFATHCTQTSAFRPPSAVNVEVLHTGAMLAPQAPAVEVQGGTH